MVFAFLVAHPTLIALILKFAYNRSANAVKASSEHHMDAPTSTNAVRNCAILLQHVKMFQGLTNASVHLTLLVIRMAKLAASNRANATNTMIALTTCPASKANVSILVRSSHAEATLFVMSTITKQNAIAHQVIWEIRKIYQSAVSELSA